MPCSLPGFFLVHILVAHLNRAAELLESGPCFMSHTCSGQCWNGPSMLEIRTDCSSRTRVQRGWRLVLASFPKWFAVTTCGSLVGSPRDTLLLCRPKGRPVFSVFNNLGNHALATVNFLIPFNDK